MIIDIILFCLFILNTYILIRLNRYLGIIEKGITLIVVLFAACLIGVGAIKSGLYQRVMNLLGKRK